MKILLTNKKPLSLDRLRTVNNDVKDFAIVSVGPSDLLPFPPIDNDITARKWVAFQSSLVEKMKKHNYGPQSSKKLCKGIPDNVSSHNSIVLESSI